MTGAERAKYRVRVGGAPTLPGKYLSRIGEGLELKCIAGRVEQKHGCLFADFAAETCIAGGHAGSYNFLFSKHPFHDVEFITHIEVAVLQCAGNVQDNQEQQAEGE